MVHPGAARDSAAMMLWLLLFLAPGHGTAAAPARSDVGERPNILWLVSEDNGPFLGCYGDPLAHTRFAPRRGLH